jgi:hypothetical protein
MKWRESAITTAAPAKSFGAMARAAAGDDEANSQGAVRSPSSRRRRASPSLSDTFRVRSRRRNAPPWTFRINQDWARLLVLRNLEFGRPTSRQANQVLRSPGPFEMELATAGF